MNNFNKLFDTYRNKIIDGINEELKYIQSLSLYPKFNRSIRYFLETPGKLIRSVLLLRSGKIQMIPEEICIKSAVAFEFFQIFTLIHDDLPALDNDYFRRGKKSLHIEFDESTAILAGDSLSIYTFKLLTSFFENKTIKKKYLKGILNFINIFSKYTGLYLIEGQIKDIENKGNFSIDQKEILDIYKKKTGLFFGLALAFGKIVNLKSWIKEFNIGVDLGVLFQLKDDLDEYYEEKVKKDELSYLNVFGFEKTKEIYNDIFLRLEKKIIKIDDFFYYLVKNFF
ncbi:MAG: polyprenyl synthetase family protein [Spirochaetes bacterium]|nr:polyprenyl synthetase family protein [Spirochaetota bacterium]